MARYIHCESCDKQMSANAKEFGELYESIKGIAIKDMSCDGGCGIGGTGVIKAGDVCYAGVLLPNMAHPNYSIHKPEAWAHDYIRLQAK